MSETKTKFQLPEKVVYVKPNFANAGWIKDSRHAAFFKVEGAYEGYTAALQRNGQLANVLTKEEKEYLEKELGFESNMLSVYNKEGLLYTRIVKLSKEPKRLNLSDPFDYIDYKILLTCTDKIAPSIKEKNKKATYKFYIEDQDDVVQINKETTSLNQRAWKAFGKMEEDRNKLIAFLKVYGQVLNKPINKIDKNVKLDFLQSQVSQIITEKMTDFVNIIESDSYDTIQLIAEAIEVGVIKKENGKYYLADGELIGKHLQEAVGHLKAMANQELVLTIQEQIKIKNK